MKWNDLLRQHKKPRGIDTSLIPTFPDQACKNGRVTVPSDEIYFPVMVNLDQNGHKEYDFILVDSDDEDRFLCTPSYLSAKTFAQKIRDAFPKQEIIILERHSSIEWTREDE